MVPLHNCCFGGFRRTFYVPWEQLGELTQERGWLADLKPAQSMVREVLWSQLVRYWAGTVESVTTSSPCDLSTVLHWKTAMRMMAKLPAEQRLQVSGASLVHGPPRRPTRAWVVDGHCHLELLRQWVSIYATVESALLYFMHGHRSSVISNQVFRAEWEAHIPAVISGVRVVRTWGAHPKALDDVDWKWLEGRMLSAECVAIGECGLDETGPNMACQEVAFKRQVQLAHQFDKTLILHLRGQNSSRTSAIYGWALAITTSILRKQHKCTSTASVLRKPNLSCGIGHSQSCWWGVRGSPLGMTTAGLCCECCRQEP